LSVARVLEDPAEDVGIALTRVEVQPADQLDGEMPQIARDQVEETARGEQG
jgi:hypothetical protein